VCVWVWGCVGVYVCVCVCVCEWGIGVCWRYEGVRVCEGGCSGEGKDEDEGGRE